MKIARILAILATVALTAACTPEMGGSGPSLSSFGGFGSQPTKSPQGTITKAANLRSNPDKNSPVIAVLPASSSVSVLTQQGGWVQVLAQNPGKSGGKTGWVSRELITIEQTASGGQRLLNLRGKTKVSMMIFNGPGENYSRVADLRAGNAVSIVAEQDGWYQFDCGVRISSNECWAPADKFWTDTPIDASAQNIAAATGTRQQQKPPQETAVSGGFNPFALLGGFAQAAQQPSRTNDDGDVGNADTADEGLAVSSLFSAFSGDDNDPQTFSEQSDTFIRNMNIGTVNLLKALANIQSATGNKELAEKIMAQAASLKRGGEAGTATSEDYKKAFAVIDNSNVSREQLAQVPAEKGGTQMVNSWIRVGLAVNADIKAFNMAQKMFNKGPRLEELLMNADKLGTVLELGLTGLPSHIEKAGSWMSMPSDYMQSNEIPQPSEDQKKRALVKDGTVTDKEADDLFGGDAGQG